MPEKGKKLNVGPISPFSKPAEPNRERERFHWTINTVINPEESILSGLNNRKWKDKFARPGHASGMGNLDSPLQQEHPSLVLLPFAPEIMGSGVGLGILKTLGGYAGSYVGSKIGNEVGYALDNVFNKHLFEPLGEIVGGFSGFGKGYNLFGKAGMQGALKYLSKTGKDVPRWFMRPELRTNVGRINQRTLFAEDQTPKYNHNQLPGLNKQPYQSPSVSQLKMIPQAAYASEVPVITKQNATSITDAQWDAAYNEAIKSENIAEAQKLRDLHFAAKTPDNKLITENGNPLTLYHFSDSRFNFFDPKKIGNNDPGFYGKGIYSSPDKAYASTYGPVEYKLYGYSKKPFETLNNEERSAASFSFNRINDGSPMIDLDMIGVRKELENADAVYQQGVSFARDDKPIWEVVVPNSKQLKLVDPITYDDSGQIIPLSKRDNFNISDIRYGYSLPNSTKGNLKQIDNFIENDIFPRMQAAGHNIEYGKTTMPILRQFDPKNDLVDRYISINGNKKASAWFSPTDNTVTFRGTSPEEADYSKAIHEIGGHGVRRNINPDYKPTTREKLNELLRLNESALYSKNVELPDINIADEVYLPQEEILLNTSYEPFFKGGDGEGNIKEYDAVNKQLRARISQMNGYKVGNDLNPIIDKFSDAKLLSLLRDLPYTQNGTLKQLSDITGIDEDTLMFASDLELNRLTKKHSDISRLLKRIKDTMKYVGGISVIGAGMNNTPQKQE